MRKSSQLLYRLSPVIAPVILGVLVSLMLGRSAASYAHGVAAALPAETVGGFTSQTLILLVDQDSTIDQTAPASNFGGAETLAVNTATNMSKQTLYRFNLSSIPSGKTVVSAIGYAFVADPASSPLNVHRISTPWAENSVTWNSFAAAFDPFVWASFTPSDKNILTGVDLTPLVRQWVAGAYPNNGLLLASSVQNDASSFASRDASLITQRPFLLITIADTDFAADNFDPSTAYSGSDGTIPWNNAWQEVAETDGATAGNVRTTTGSCSFGECLRLATGVGSTGKGIKRELNLQGATASELSFNLSHTVGSNLGQLELSVSINGGDAWTTLASYNLGGSYPQPQTFDIRAHAAANTQVRWLVTGSSGGAADYFFVDDVRVTFDNRGIGGRLWQDLDRDGVRENGEPALFNVKLEIYESACSELSALPQSVATSDGSGQYIFASLAPGDFCVLVDENSLPVDLISTSNGLARTVTLAANQLVDNVDFGFASAVATERLTVGIYQPCLDIAWLQTLAQTHHTILAVADSQACNFTFGGASANLTALQQAAANDPRTRHAVNDIYVQGAFTPNDPFYGNSNLVYAPQQINAPAAWDLTLGDPNLVVALLDTGIDLNHPEFAGRLLPGFDFVNNDSTPADDNGHGTHVAGIVAAGIDNGIGIAGIAGRSKLLPVKVLNAKNQGYWSNVAKGITWAVDRGAQVINLSIGGSTNVQSMRDAVAYALAHNVLVVAAAGNENTSSARYPASYEDVLSVAGWTANGSRWPLSNYSVNVDLMAPGATIYSSIWITPSTSSYQSLSGTSMAAPHVTGVTALMLSRNPNLTPVELRAILQNTALDVGAPGVDEYTGHGRIDALAALAAVTPTALLTPTTSMTVTLVDDLSANQLVESGDIVRYTIRVANNGAQVLPNVLVQSAVPVHTNYITNSTQLNGIPVQDNRPPAAATALPLDEGGLNIGELTAQSSVIVSYDVLVDEASPLITQIVNTSTVQSVAGLAVLTTTTTVTPILLGDCNGDLTVNAGDMSALVLELFDMDGSNPRDTRLDGFLGVGLACDPNRDNNIDAGDLSCTVLLLFDGPGACSGD